MNHDSPRPIVERAKRPPSPRNIQIYEAVRWQGRRQADVARQYGVNQKRISQICQQVDRWQEWLQSAPDREAIAAEQRRQALQQAYQRSERLLLIALRREAQSGQRDAPESAWLKIALRASRDVVQIGQKLGADLPPSAEGREVDELLAELVISASVAELARVRGNAGSLATSATGFETAPKSSRSSKISQFANAGNAGNGTGKLDAKHYQDETSGEWDGADDVEMEGISRADFLIWEIGKELTDSAQSDRPNGQSNPKRERGSKRGSKRAAPSLTRRVTNEVRARRAKFLQSGGEPQADKMRLVSLKPQ